MHTAGGFLTRTLLLIAPVVAQDHFGNWPEGKSPKEIGKRVAERFVASPHANFGKPTPAKLIIYPETCTWYGSLTFAKLTDDKALTESLLRRFDPLFGAEAHLVPTPNHVDSTVFGAVPLEIYQQNRDQKFLTLGLAMADSQWEPPTPEARAQMSPELQGWVDRGLSPQTRLWIDDMFMITMVQAQAFRASGEVKYIDRAATEMVFYLDQLQQPNGLFHHAPDVPFLWGRGDGWMAAGMAELLRTLPENHSNRPRILDGYRTMMASLLNLQAEDGMWRQLLDDPTSWPESSCTGMFTFAMITGVKNGWLDAASYGPAARKG